MTTTNVSTFVCDHRKNIHYVCSDGLKLFSWAEIANLRDIFKDTSLPKLKRLFDECDTKHMAMNWELSPLMPIPYKEVYCSAILWMDIIVLRVSLTPLPSFFFDLAINEAGPATVFSQTTEKVETEAGDVTYENLSSELSSLQRSLQGRNIQLEDLNDRLEDLATTDPLTGLLNRRSILKQAGFELVRTKRTRKFFGLAMFDIDDFKNINEQYGREIGDKCLIEIARMLNISTRTYDGVGRFGSDEFLLYLPLDSKEQFKTVLQRIHEKLQPVTVKTEDGVEVHPTVSAGGVSIESANYPNVLIPELLVKVDQVLIYVQEKGKAQIAIKDF
ncbi:MAG: GGDEF domain-containing protein [Anaerolineaceae bacterium]|jgi:diguanylate cyclase (GGDEF)-like protein|nr:GGDEF domain-containing protein [Anaerolineaceae bacterium]